LGATVVNAVCFAAVWVVLWRRGWLRVSGVAVPGPLRRWWLTLPTLAVACSYAVAGLEGRTTVLVSSLVSLLWVSINEELYSRGLVQQVLTPVGPTRAAIGVGLLFGAGHFQNYLFFGAPLDDTLWQMLSAGSERLLPDPFAGRGTGLVAGVRVRLPRRVRCVAAAPLRRGGCSSVAGCRPCGP
jgi:hypothetical protein